MEQIDRDFELAIAFDDYLDERAERRAARARKAAEAIDESEGKTVTAE